MASGQAVAMPGPTADAAAGGPFDGVTVTILNAGTRTGTHLFTTAARNDAVLALHCGHD